MKGIHNVNCHATNLLAEFCARQRQRLPYLDTFGAMALHVQPKASNMGSINNFLAGLDIDAPAPWMVWVLALFIFCIRIELYVLGKAHKN